MLWKRGNWVELPRADVQLQEKLGEGAFGEAYKGLVRIGREFKLCAVKRLKGEKVLGFHRAKNRQLLAYTQTVTADFSVERLYKNNQGNIQKCKTLGCAVSVSLVMLHIRSIVWPR